VAALNLQAAAENVRAAEIEAAAIRYAADTELTRQAAEDEAAAIRAAKSEAGQNYRAELALTQVAADTARANAEAAIIRAQAEAARVEVDAQNRLVGGGVMVAGLAFVAWFLSLLWRSRKPSEIAESDELQDGAEPEPARQWIDTSAHTHHPDYVPVDDDTFRVWAERRLAGETAGINQWEGGDSPFVGKRDKYKPFLVWAEKRKYIEVKSGAKVLSQIGRNFCAGWLARNATTAPLAPLAPESADLTGYHAIPCMKEAPEVGEGE
jgi:hypothetical protein